jgi:hypothetical protein
MRQPVRALIANGTLKRRIPIAVFCLLASPAPRPQRRWHHAVANRRPQK